MLCPVGAVAAYLAVRGRSQDPFFGLASHASLARDTFGNGMREALQPAVLTSPGTQGTNFRIEAASKAGATGM